MEAQQQQPYQSSLEDSFVSIHEKMDSTNMLEREVQETSNGFEQQTEKSELMDLNVPRRLKLSVRRTEDRAEATGATEGPGTDNFLSTLKARLAATEYPDEIESAGWGYGIDTKTVKMLTQEWLHHYNWEEQLEHLNRDFEHWTCRVNGLDIHYVRHDPWAEEEGEEMEAKAFAGKSKANEKGEVIMPLLLIHGWPGSWYEFGKAIQLLKKRGRFQIIVPSLPGYGWSQAPSQKKFGVREIAKTLHELMQYLGYKYYLAQGGDWGAIITRTLATLYPDSCLAIHINMLPCLPPRPWTRPFQSLKAATGFLFPSLIYRNHPREQASVEALKAYAIEEGAYFFIQATKPQTLGHALHDSPVGLLSWLGEKYLSWADLDPHKPETWPFSKTELLTQIMIYHSTGTITSSTRIYYEAHHNKDVEWMLKSPVPHRVPVGVGVWNKELFMVPKAWADDWMNIQSWHEFPKGGHFAAFERPVEFEKEITEFFTKEQVLDRFSAKRLGLKI